MRNLSKLKEQAKHLLYLLKGFVFINSWIIPIIMFVMNGINFAIFWNYLKTQSEPQIITTIDINISQVSDLSLTALVLLFCISHKWNVVSWITYICLCCLWIINTIYKNMPYVDDAYQYHERSIYFCFYLCIIYVTGVISSIYMLSKRN